MLIIPVEPDVPQSVKYVDIFFTAIEIELRPKVGPHIHLIVCPLLAITLLICLGSEGKEDAVAEFGLKADIMS